MLPQTIRDLRLVLLPERSHLVGVYGPTRFLNLRALGPLEQPDFLCAPAALFYSEPLG
jgi:hypothetical protein